MDSMYEQNQLSSIDMAEMGVNPLHWINVNKDIESTNEYTTIEKTLDVAVYPVELSLTNLEKELTTSNDDLLMSSDDDDCDNYDTDPETGMFVKAWSLVD